jgi:hypothetical protein
MYKSTQSKNGYSLGKEWVGGVEIYLLKKKKTWVHLQPTTESDRKTS